MSLPGFDATPEDSYDPDDAVPRLVDNIVRRLELVVDLRALPGRGQQRLALAADDLRHVAARIHAGQIESCH